MITITEYDFAPPTEHEKIAALDREEMALVYHAPWGDIYACTKDEWSSEPMRARSSG